MQQQTVFSDKKAQIYLRAEPTDETRDRIMRHRVHLSYHFEKMGVKNHLASRGEFHRTEIFLDSALKWERAFKNIGIKTEITGAEIVSLVDMPPQKKIVADGIPVGYEAFFSGQGYYAAVLKFAPIPFFEELLIAVKNNLLRWEEAGKIPDGSAAKLIASKFFPLARDRYENKPHVTLLRGKVNNANIRKVVMEALSVLNPIAEEKIEFSRIDLRSVRSQKVIARYAGQDKIATSNNP